MAHPDKAAGRGSLTLRERQALRRGEKVYRNGISVDRRGRPIAGDPKQPIDSTGQPVKSMITGGGDDGADYDQGSEINTMLGKNELGQDMMQTDTYGISGDESTKVTTTSTHFEGVDYAGLSDYELSKFDQAGNEGWIYKTHQRGEGEVGYTGDKVRDKIRIKVNKYGTPWKDPNAGKYPTGTGDDDEDPDANTLTSDDEGRFPGEPGYGKGPDWKPPFQSGGVDDPSDAEIAFMMDDSNYGIGGDLLETNTETGANIETFELGKGYGNVGGWEPTPRKSTLTETKGRGETASMNASAKPNTQRRAIREKRTLLTGNV